MGIRIEWLFIGITSLLILFGLEVDIETPPQHHLTEKKPQLRLTNTTLLEVGSEGVESFAYATEGVKEGEIFSLENLRYHTYKITNLEAKKAFFQKERVDFMGHILFESKEGYTYISDDASYCKRESLLVVEGNFTATMGKNTLFGSSLHLNVQTKHLKAKQIRFIFFTSESNQQNGIMKPSIEG